MLATPPSPAPAPGPARFTAADRRYMLRALALAARAGYRTHPNPQVGCVIVRDGKVVGQGYHRRRGEPHAEVLALREAGEAARGATVYVTLEPCAHHGLTPPCADALVAAGVSRVVAAMVDPDPRVRGRGLDRLRRAGVQVDVGLLEDMARALNRPWLHWKVTGRPYVLLKGAASLDGRIATRTGESRWISGESSRAAAHQLRDHSDAILVGVGTVLADDPQLTARPREPGPLGYGWGLPDAVRQAAAGRGEAGGGGAAPPWQPRNPLRVVVDSHARTPVTARLLPALVAVTPMAPPERVRALRAAGAEVVELPAGPDGRVDLERLLDELGRREVVSLLVEGGGQVHGALLDRRLAQGVRLYLAPLLLGGAAPPLFAGQGPEHLTDAPRLARSYVGRADDDIVVEGDIEYPGQADRTAEREG